MKFIIDAMFPPETTRHLDEKGHDSVTPSGLGAGNLPDTDLIAIATEGGRVIVTENASDFATVTTCAVLLVRKTWRERQHLATRLASAVDRWAAAHPDPGPWAHWLESRFR